MNSRFYSSKNGCFTGFIGKIYGRGSLARRIFCTASATVPMLLGGCSSPNAPAFSRQIFQTEPPVAATLFWVQNIDPWHLAYAPDREKFPPILTETFAYPTQSQAQDAYANFLAEQARSDASPKIIYALGPTDHLIEEQKAVATVKTVHLFGCKPGALDSQTVRIVRSTGPIVHCAADFLDGDSQMPSRRIVNFAYHHGRWHFYPTDAPQAPVVWREREASPKDSLFWLPGRERYQ